MIQKKGDFMQFKFFLRSLICTFMFSNALLVADGQELLKTQDIHKIMEQILSQHAEKNKMTGSVIKNSLKIYVEEFDPFRTYLLDAEIAPYLHLSDSDLQKIVDQYEENNYTVYEKLNELFTSAIMRSRKIREELEKNSNQSFESATSLTTEGREELLLNKGFAPNLADLKTRIKNQLVVLVESSKKRYGDAYVKKNQNAIIDMYEKRIKTFENQYLFNHQDNKHLTKVEKDNLFVMHILKSLAKGLDAHTEFYNPTEAHDMKMHLENTFQGIGVVLQDSPEGIVVSSLLPGTPAAKSGLVKVNDQIVEIDGQNISELEVDDAADKLQGKAGTTVALLIKRKVLEGSQVQDKQFTVQLKREPITIDEDRVVSTFEHFGNGIIGKLTLNSFYQNENGVSSEKDIREAILTLEKTGNLRGLILDLRENTGGFLSQAVKVAGLFITNGVVVISKYSNGDERFFRDMDGKTTYQGPLIILTSKMTASAAEIVAQALQDYGVAVVVGDEHTYGKGTVQTQTVTQDKAASFFKVTIGKYYTVSGKTPQIKGVIADVTVPGKYSNERIGEVYLGSHTLKNDTIDPSFNDKFEDIDSKERPWYLHYYVPSEQHKTDVWKSLIPTLKKNSGYRIGQNKNYQMYLKRLKGEPDDINPEDETRAVKNFGNDDLQMMEAVNVLKDMIYLESKTVASP
jgi:carboxyl-terminal processing protease